MGRPGNAASLIKLTLPPVPQMSTSRIVPFYSSPCRSGHLRFLRAAPARFFRDSSRIDVLSQRIAERTPLRPRGRVTASARHHGFALLGTPHPVPALRHGWRNNRFITGRNESARAGELRAGGVQWTVRQTRAISGRRWNCVPRSRFCGSGRDHLASERVYLRATACDMRNSFDGFQTMELDPFAAKTG